MAGPRQLPAKKAKHWPHRKEWFTEPILPNLLHRSELKGTRFQGKTAFQGVKIIETGPFGLVLLLDGRTQSAEADEFIYHEALVHPALTTHPAPRRVLICGGGEGGTLREVLAHRSVEEAVMVDIDGELMGICKEHLTQWHQGSFENPRAHVITGDAIEYLHMSRQPFDAIIVDITDPEPSGSYLLYTKGFYELIAKCLSAEGVMVTQAGPATQGMTHVLEAVAATVQSAFGESYPYQAEVLSYGSNWGFVMASKGRSPLDLTVKEVDQRLALHSARDLRLYDGIAHRGMFGLPKWLRKRLASAKDIITDDAPVSLFSRPK